MTRLATAALTLAAHLALFATFPITPNAQLVAEPASGTLLAAKDGGEGDGKDDDEEDEEDHRCAPRAS